MRVKGPFRFRRSARCRKIAAGGVCISDRRGAGRPGRPCASSGRSRRPTACHVCLFVPKGFPVYPRLSGDPASLSTVFGELSTGWACGIAVLSTFLLRSGLLFHRFCPFFHNPARKCAAGARNPPRGCLGLASGAGVGQTPPFRSSCNFSSASQSPAAASPACFGQEPGFM